MSKKIHTIQSSDKKEFEDEINLFIEYGSELMEGSYEIIKNDKGVIYSQVVLYDPDCISIKMYENGQNENLTFRRFDDDGHYSEELHIFYYNNGKKRKKGNKQFYPYPKKFGFWTYWYDNGQKKKGR